MRFITFNLLRWRFVIHGGIDGYSRMVVYLKCSNNNKSVTVLQCFQEAVELFGLPKHVRYFNSHKKFLCNFLIKEITRVLKILLLRADMGIENRDVAWFMLNHPARGPLSKSFITGKSVHNQRIERLWKDVFQG